MTRLKDVRSTEVTDAFDIEERWPELFDQLDESQRRAVLQVLAADRHEGWAPEP